MVCEIILDFPFNVDGVRSMVLEVELENCVVTILKFAKLYGNPDVVIFPIGESA